MGRTTRHLSVLCVLMITALTIAKNIYVNGANTGSQDGNSFATGYKTIQQAADVAVAGDVVFVGAGTYCESVKPANSGTSENPITFKNYNSEKPLICGGDKITGAWTLDANSIYWAPCNWTLGQGFDQVVVDGDLMIDARFPNISGKEDLVPVRSVGKLFDVQDLTSSSLRSEGLTQPTDFWTGGIFWGACGNNWTCQSAIITGSSSSGTLAISNPSDPWFPGWGKGCVIGCKNALDSDKEWYLDAAAGRLYLRGPGGANPTGKSIYVKKRNIVLDLSSLNYVIVDSINSMMGGILMVGSSNCQLRNSRNLYSCHYWRFTQGYSGSLQDGTANDPREQSLSVSGSNNLVEGCEFAYTAAGVRLGGTSNTIRNTSILDAGYAGSYISGLHLKGSFNNLIERCSIGRVGRTTIQVEGGPNRILHCELFDFMHLSNDGGATYVWTSDGKGTVLAYNWIHGEKSGREYEFNNGIYWDNNTTDFTSHHNVLWDMPTSAFGDNEASNIRNYNNTAIVGKKYQACTGGCGGCPSYNNLSNQTDFNAGWNAGFDVQNCITDASHFINAGEGGLKYRPAANSPAVNAGRMIAGITDSYAGSAPDAGAYEYGGPDSVSNWTAGAWSVDGGGPTPAVSGRYVGSRASQAFRTTMVDGAIILTGVHGAYNIKITNSQGRIVASLRAKGTARLQTRLPCGSYIVQAKTPAGSQTNRICITR